MITSTETPKRPSRLGWLCAAAAAALLVGSQPAQARGLFGSHDKSAGAEVSSPIADAAATSAAQAISEHRYLDASGILDAALANGVTSPELTLLNGEVLLARGQFEGALGLFEAVRSQPGEEARALEGEGLAYASLDRPNDAVPALQAAVQKDPSLWRAWNALGASYDQRQDWAAADAAYARALSAPGVETALVRNNHGYSLLLRRRIDEAVKEFVGALERDPALTSARTNLRLALALEGRYDKASVSGVGEDRAAVLNNVGLAAAMRGDYAAADRLLNEAISARGQFYGRASENLQMAHALQSSGTGAGAPPAP